MIRFDQHKEQEGQDEDVLVATEREHEIILYNDDVNTFDHVIKTLIAVCEHTPQQAEQCAMIVLASHHRDHHSSELLRLSR